MGSLAVAAIALVVTVGVVGPTTIAAQIEAIGPWFAVVLAIEIAATGCDAAALRHYLGAAAPRPSYLTVVKAQVTGRAINAVTPLGGLGEAAKVTTLLGETPPARAIAAVIRYDLAVIATSLVAIIAGAPVCAATLALPAWLVTALFAGAGVSAILLVGGALLIRRGMLSSLADALAGLHVVSPRRVARWRTRLVGIDELLRTRAPRGAWVPIAWVVAARLLSWLSAWVVLAGTGHLVGVGTMAALATAGLVISWSSMIVPMGLGLSDGGTAALFVALGASPSLGVTVVLGQRVTQLLYAAFGLTLLGAPALAGSRLAHASGASSITASTRVGLPATERAITDSRSRKLR
jgi:Lysylphosphatidylglycerol synthase TM region